MIYPASSLERYTANEAISSGVPCLPAGIPRVSCILVPTSPKPASLSTSIEPGPMQFAEVGSSRKGKIVAVGSRLMALSVAVGLESKRVW